MLQNGTGVRFLIFRPEMSIFSIWDDGIGWGRDGSELVR